MMFAFLEFDPKSHWGKGRKPRILEPRTPDEGPRWHEEDWSIGTQMFTGKKNLHHFKAGVGIRNTNTHTVYDARKVPTEAEWHLKDLDFQINVLRQKYQAYVQEHFKEWPIVEQADCVKVIPAKYASEKEAKAAMGPQPKLTAKQKREAAKQAQELSDALNF